MSSGEIAEALESLFVLSTTGTHPSVSRFYTLKAMIQLGPEWHTSGEIMRQLKDLKINTNYVFELVARVPTIVEASQDHSKVRIRHGAFQTVSNLVDSYIERILSLKR